MKKNTPFTTRQAMIDHIKAVLKARDDYRAAQNRERPENRKLRSFVMEEAFRDATAN